MFKLSAVLRIILIAKCLFIVTALVAFMLAFDFKQGRYRYEILDESTSALINSPLTRWDIAHYLRLSQEGFKAGSDSCAFYPFWPAIICASSWLALGHRLLAALFVANGLSLAAFCIFYRLVDHRHGPAVARDALILLLAFPGSLFFSIPYTESLFLLLVMVLFQELDRDRYFWIVVMAFLLPMTKAIGVFIAIPLAWHLWERKKSWKHWLVLTAPLLGYASYFGIMHAFTGNAFEGFAAQRYYPNSPSIKNMVDFTGFVSAFLNVGSIDGMLDSVLDRLLFLLFLVLMPMVWRLNRTWFWYSFAAGIIPVLTNWFLSYRRFLLVCFPLFIVMALLLQQWKNRWVFWYYVVVMAVFQAWSVVQYMRFNWVG